jgi:hypothetical protein
MDAADDITLGMKWYRLWGFEVNLKGSGVNWMNLGESVMN